MPGADVVHHAFSELPGLVAERSLGRIEGLGQQQITTRKQKKSARVNGARLRTEQRTIFAAVERCVIDRVVRRPGGIVVKCKIEEVLAVGKKKRPAMRGVLSRVDLRNQNWSSSTGIDTHQGRLRARRVQDHSARSPGAPAAQRSVGNRLHRAAVEVNRLQLVIGEESEGAAVG